MTARAGRAAGVRRVAGESSPSVAGVPRPSATAVPSPSATAVPSPRATGSVAPGTTLDALETLAFALVSLTARAITQETLPRQLTFQQWRALVVLGDGGGAAPLADDEAPRAPMRVSELGRRIGASGPSTSRIVQRLVAHGLVSAAPDSRDRRAHGLRLTARGLDLRSRVVTRRRELIGAAIGHASGDSPSAELQRLVEDLAPEV